MSRIDYENYFSIETTDDMKTKENVSEEFKFAIVKFGEKAREFEKENGRELTFQELPLADRSFAVNTTLELNKKEVKNLLDPDTNEAAKAIMGMDGEGNFDSSKSIVLTETEDLIVGYQPQINANGVFGIVFVITLEKVIACFVAVRDCESTAAKVSEAEAWLKTIKPITGDGAKKNVKKSEKPKRTIEETDNFKVSEKKGKIGKW